MIFIALGSNLPGQYGSPDEALAAAQRALPAHGLRIEKSSNTWRSPPFPPSDQPWFCNAVVSVRTDLPAEALLTLLKEIEKEFGRQHAPRNAARVLDLDILAYHDEVYNQGGLVVPHPRMSERGFVLYPLQEVAPNWIHPVSKENIAELIQRLPAEQRAVFASEVAR